MKTRILLVCEECGEPLLSLADGVLLQGNLYPAGEGPAYVNGAFGPLQMPSREMEDGTTLPGAYTVFDPAKVEQCAFHKACLAHRIGLITVAPGRPSVQRFPAAPVGGPPSTLLVGTPAVGAEPGIALAGAMVRDLGGPVQKGDKVRLLEGPFFTSLGGVVLTVDRFREVDQDYALHAPDGRPIIATFRQFVKVTGV